MKTAIHLLICFFTGFTFYSCEKTDDADFKNEIILGTGLNPSNSFELTGVGNTFTSISGSAVIYFRLESADDMEGNTVLLDFETMNNSLINTISRTPGQDYGHILVSSFEWLWTTGNYQVKAYLDVDGTKKFIAKTSFTIQ